MSEIASSVDVNGLVVGNDAGLELRIFRTMIVSVGLAVITSGFLAPWRVMTGLLLGDALSLLNYHWLRTSMAAVFRGETTGKRPRVKILRYVIRYFVIGAVVIAAYKLNLISL